MKKRTLALILVVVLVLALAVPSMAAGRGNNNNNGRGYGRSNGHYGLKFELHAERDEAKILQYWYLEWLVYKANAEIEQLVAYAQATPQNDVEWLVEKTNAIAAEVKAYGDSIGAVVECTYTEYYVDGEYVLIDPLRVIDLGGSGGTKKRN